MKSNRNVIGLLVAGVALVAMALAASTAMARTPAPGYEAFAGCPSPEENSNVFACIHTVIDGGHFQMGTKDVPITKPINLSGGAEGELIVANKSGGLTPVRQQVPGGVIGITGLDWLVNFLNIEQLKLFAVTELVGQPRNGPLGELVLPIRVHLENSALGNSCYVGSPASPITLRLTTGTTNPPPPNKPISGKVPGEEIDAKRSVFIFRDGTYVDNSFAAPGASGCQLTLFGFIPISLNGLVNSQSGLPSPAGMNATAQNFDTEFAPQAVVYP